MLWKERNVFNVHVDVHKGQEPHPSLSKSHPKPSAKLAKNERHKWMTPYT